jgi:hypothetical protein
MKRFLTRVIFALLAIPITNRIAWTEAERALFDNFFRSPAGRKFLEFLRQQVAQATFNAVYQDKVSACAYARGQQDLLAIFIKLRVFPEVSESSNISDGLGLEEMAAGGVASNGQSDDWRWIGGGGAIG